MQRWHLEILLFTKIESFSFWNYGQLTPIFGFMIKSLFLNKTSFILLTTIVFDFHIAIFNAIADIIPIRGVHL